MSPSISMGAKERAAFFGREGVDVAFASGVGALEGFVEGGSAAFAVATGEGGLFAGEFGELWAARATSSSGFRNSPSRPVRVC